MHLHSDMNLSCEGLNRICLVSSFSNFEIKEAYLCHWNETFEVLSNLR